MSNLKFQFTKKAPNVVELIDPVTEGVWRVVAPHDLSIDGAILAIEQTLKEKNIQPKKGSVLTVVFSIKVQEEGETVHPIFDGILAQIAELKRNGPR
jgi:hypothetical protein